MMPPSEAPVRTSSLLAPLALTGALLALACGGALDDTDDFSAVVDAPALVQKGQPFTVTVTISNSAAEPQVLESLDIADEWLAGVTIQSSSPPYGEAMHVPIDGTWSYSYQETIPAGGSVAVTLQATGVQTGSFRGEVDVCVGGMARFRSYPLVTTVE